jgi:hypothetical protein
MFQDNLEGGRNLKCMLYVFEHLSGLKISYHRIEICCFNKASLTIKDYKSIFACVEGSLPLKYLGLPAYLRIMVVELFCINHVLELFHFTRCLWHLPFCKIPCKRMDFFMKGLLWQKENNAKKDHVVT